MFMNTNSLIFKRIVSPHKPIWKKVNLKDTNNLQNGNA